MEKTNRNIARTLSLLATIGIHPIKKADNEYASPCPICEKGTDRFITFFNNNQPSFWCRRCGWSGGLNKLLMKVKGVSYADAITKTGSIQSSSKRRFKSQKKDITRNANIQSKKKWYRTARVILTASQEELRHNKKMIDWLKKKRGITKRTALEVGLGYNPETRLYFRKEWGLTKEIKPDGKEKMVYLPKGFIIPMTTKIGRIVRLRIRMDKPIGESRYISVTGSRSPPLLFGNWKAKICLIVESELDAILLYQEIKNVFVIALGSATNKLTRNQERLLIGKEVYLSLDSDDAGVEATGRLIEKYPIFKVLPIIEGKDHTEAFLNDLDLKEWFNVGRKLAK